MLHQWRQVWTQTAMNLAVLKPLTEPDIQSQPGITHLVCLRELRSTSWHGVDKWISTLNRDPLEAEFRDGPKQENSALITLGTNLNHDLFTNSYQIADVCVN